KAQDRFRIARKAFERMQSWQEFHDLEDEWFTFLRARKAIYTILEQGAKADPKSTMWFGKKNAARRRDPPLQYLYQARNDDEHGLTDNTKRVPARSTWGKMTGDVATVEKLTISMENGVPTFTHEGKLEGIDPVVEHHGPKVMLVPVRDRNGTVY